MTLFKPKRSKTWHCRFVLHGIRVAESTGTSDEALAMAWEAQRREAIHREYCPPPQQLTLHEVAQMWLAGSQVSHRDAHNNVGRVRKLFGTAMVPQPGGRLWVEKEGGRAGLSKDLLVSELRQKHLMDLKAARIREGNKAATVNIEISLVQSLVGFAATMNVVVPETPIIWSHRRNKAASLKSTTGRGKLRWLTMEEEARLLASLRRRIDEFPNSQAIRDNYELVVMLLDTGGRYGEIAGLPWSAVNLEAGTINLYRHKVQNESTLTLTARVLALLRARKRRQQAEGHFSYVFPACTQRGWSGLDKPRGHATFAIQKHINACGLNDDPERHRVTPHTFRDTFASRLAQAGVSLLKISHLLGHTTTVMTQKYAHLCPDAAGSEAAKVLNALHAQSASNAHHAPATPRPTRWMPRLVVSASA
ncbi:MAG: hypothetical protein DI587_03325 [Variovorax paradoxus]|nr:MAG: hypothetical protein DI583_03325 [Variovorax paradoxus]PZQ15729.1 MAG: hypothetical protein DI587_03325 [Variovorax paradoxus]